jgi:hypothetical protein
MQQHTEHRKKQNFFQHLVDPFFPSNKDLDFSIQIISKKKI